MGTGPFYKHQFRVRNGVSLRDDAIGQIYYSDSGSTAAQIRGISRERISEPSNLVHEYLAYLVAMKSTQKEKWSAIYLKGNSSPGGHSKILIRRYRFEGDLMSLKPVDGMNREITWKRVRSE
jgi:hypothetical protein